MLESFLNTELATLEHIITRTLADELRQLKIALNPPASERTNAISRKSSSTIAHKITKRALPLPCGSRKRFVLTPPPEAEPSTRIPVRDWIVLKPKSRCSHKPDMVLPVVSERDLGLMTEDEINRRIDQIPAGLRDDDDCSTQLTTQANALAYVQKYLKVTEELLLKVNKPLEQAET